MREWYRTVSAGSDPFGFNPYILTYLDPDIEELRRFGLIDEQAWRTFKAYMKRSWNQSIPGYLMPISEE